MSQRSLRILAAAVAGLGALGVVSAARLLARRRGLLGGEAPGDLAGKVAVVCGGSRGLGRAVARELARSGASVAICARSEQALAEAFQEIDALGVPVIAHVCDLRDEVQTRGFLARVTEELGPIDVLVANAATITVGPIETVTPTQMTQAMRAIFGTTVNAALAALPAMQARRRGTIAIVGSIGGKIGVPHLAPYSAAKFACLGFAETLRAEVAKDGVRIMSVVPGLMRTGSHVHARFRGRPEAELGWFGTSAMMPLLSIDADRAARRIVRGIRRGADEVVLTPAAYVVGRTRDLFPSLWSAAMAIASRLLPRAPEAGPRVIEKEGEEVFRASSSPFLHALEKRTAPVAARQGQ